MTGRGALLLTAADVRAALDWPALLAATRSAVLADVGQRLALSSQLAVPSASLHLKAGALLEPPVLSVKANLRPEAGGSSGAVLLFDHAAGELAAVLPGADLTAMRTGALAAVAAQALLTSGSPSVALIGAGPVARRALQALGHVLDVARVRVWSRSPASAQALLDEQAPDGRVCASPAEAARGADLVVTCTPSRAALLDGPDLADGAVVLAMGADTPGKRELGPDVLPGADVVVDVLGDALVAGECAHLPGPRDDLLVLGEVLAGLPVPRARRLLVFDSVGSAAVDAAAGALVLAQARARGLGAVLDLAGPAAGR